MLCKLQGDYIKATDLYHQVSLKYEAVFGRTHPLYLNSLAAYGACLLEVKELETAAGVFDKLVKGRRKAQDLHGFFEATLQLAGTYRELTHYEKSHRMLTESYPLAMKEYGDNSAMQSNFLY
jgi:tetratricopeptide (TPR) repeat protein